MANLISIQIGEPEFYPANAQSSLASKPWLTGFFKTPVTGSVQIGPTGIQGDGQADLISHGGEDKAICAYPSEHFEYWNTFLDHTDEKVHAGGFGENFTTAGLHEDDICIGDQFRVGTVIVEVSQPRQPCWKLARRWDRKSMTPEVQRTGKTGWYFRVIEPGQAAAGMPLEKLDSTSSDWTITAANQIMHGSPSPEQIKQFVSLPTLSSDWRNNLSARIQ